MDNNQPGYRYPSIEMRKSSDRRILYVIGVLILITLVIFLVSKNKQTNPQVTQPTPTPISNQQGASPSATPSLTIGKRIKTTGCISTNGLPDKACTPGDIDPKVTQDNIQSTICVSGYTKTVRPSVTYTNNLKIQQIQEYGYSDTNPKDYEEDHLISLELGGSPTSEANLWPEPYNANLNAREKDKVENYLRSQVCTGKIILQQAQLQIANNWEEVYQKITH
ncbi:MAG: hypothetical protein HYV37_03330 [Candidatus Levyibacteriota bacterium]|nr:MAG: hypothetical protein HYV37_03330 [Candidatus Levybacteria bacterium]